MEHHRKKATTITISLGIIICVLIFTVLYFQNRNPRANKFEQARQQQSLIESVMEQAPRRGSFSPKTTLIEFGDFQCLHCKQIAPLINDLIERRGDKLQHIWIHVASDAHVQSEQVAIASQCAYEQDKFWEYHDELFANQDDLSPLLYNQIAIDVNLDVKRFQICLGSEQTKELVRNHNLFARTNNITSTPSFFLDSQQLPDQASNEELISLIEQALN